jgi:predicted unusual protein kinase regulating ubiquinone biosynthesis (AarF/ABC1/UbiB family)
MLLNRVIQTGRFVVSVRRRMAPGKPVDKRTADWFRRELQEMGPTYIKIGQFISSRRDIFDEKIIDSLRTLQDAVDPAPEEEMRALMSSRLSGYLDQFSEISLKPIACASIGQVHPARTRSGKKVAIKVRRPGVQENLDMDMTILMGMLSIMDLLNTENIRETRELLHDFKTWFEEEMDYGRELENSKKLRESIKNQRESIKNQRESIMKSPRLVGIPAGVVMPDFYEKLCHDDLIVMSFVESRKIRDIMPEMTKKQRKDLAIRLMDLFLGMLIVDGVVHGDPHEGNIGLDAQGRIVLYDMGNVITVDHDRRQKLKTMLFEIASGSYEDALAVMKRIDLFEVRDDAKVLRLLERYAEYMQSVDFHVMQKMASDGTMRGSLPVKFSCTVFRIVRVFALLEGICKDLDPEFTYVPIMAKYMQVMGGDRDYLVYRVMSDVRKVARTLVSSLEV